MKTVRLWSVHMWASESDENTRRHLSAAERLVEEPHLNQVVDEMVLRAKTKDPNDIQISLDLVPPNACRHVRCLPVQTVHTASPERSAALAAEILIRAGVSPKSALAGLAALRNGLGPRGQSLPGASLWDKDTGERVEPDFSKGIRANRFDYSSTGAGVIESTMADYGLTYARTREALAVATKTVNSGVTAEICWSSEPAYTTGYIASPRYGYVRLTGFKPYGACGGRICFIDLTAGSVEDYVERLEREFVLIEPPVVIHDPVSAEEFLDQA